ncbi:MAG: DUF4038 domain-containing protein, partial [Candidatus Marinimicrobia bacterium]|nr:DUF4038 domain-containing protein [Candidatus Neomarinimicrobiota bacterium]
EVELVFTAERDYENPYTDVEIYVQFSGPDDRVIKRPAFWDGGDTWRVRFASPTASGVWHWESISSETSDSGLHGLSGSIRSVEYSGDNRLLQHGLLRMSPGRRTVVHADGTPFLMIGDTPWALPYRGTEESVTTYAQNRRERGFNSALLMSVQPDRKVKGPRDRTAEGGFGVAFEDLPDGHLNQLNPGYFKTLDSLIDILVEHGIVPVYNPVFQGFGWKGGQTLGNHADPGEYSRYVRYLIARYGARPAMWLISADGYGNEPVVKPAGETVQEWDAYEQPTGIHYSPYDDFKPDWSDEPRFGFHFNRANQDEEWLDFQWTQTGHNTEHHPHEVFRMYENEPTRAVANGEPTYERIGGPDRATGWWQGHEAWLNLTSGGTMGVVYGAGGLWNWKLSPDEEGWPDWANTQASWDQSIHFEGSNYVGYLSKALDRLDLTDIQRRHDLAYGALALARESELYIVYLPEGGPVQLGGIRQPLPYRWFNPRTGEWAGSGTLESGSVAQLTAPDMNPWVLIATNDTAALHLR